MDNLNDIFQAAHGGEALQNLAQQYGVPAEQLDTAVQAMLPAFSAALQKQASDPWGLGSLITQMTDDHHGGAFGAADVALHGDTAAKGNELLAQMFSGNSQVAGQVAQHAADVSGLGAGLLKKLMPIIISMVVGGLFSSLKDKGLGGVFGDLANAGGAAGPAGNPNSGSMGGGGLGDILGQIFGGGAQPSQGDISASNSSSGSLPPLQGELGDVLGQVFGNKGGGTSYDPLSPTPQAEPQAQAPAQQSGGLGDLLGGLLGSVLGGGGLGGALGGNPGQQPAGQAGQGMPNMPGIDASTLQAGLETLSKILMPGGSGGAQANPGLQDILGQILGPKR